MASSLFFAVRLFVGLFALCFCLFIPIEQKRQVYFKKEGAAHAANKPRFLIPAPSPVYRWLITLKLAVTLTNNLEDGEQYS